MSDRVSETNSRYNPILKVVAQKLIVSLFHLHMSSRLSMTAGVHRPPRHPQLLGRHPNRSDRSTRPGLSHLLDHPLPVGRVRSCGMPRSPGARSRAAPGLREVGDRPTHHPSGLAGAPSWDGSAAPFDEELPLQDLRRGDHRGRRGVTGVASAGVGW